MFETPMARHERAACSAADPPKEAKRMRTFALVSAVLMVALAGSAAWAAGEVELQARIEGNDVSRTSDENPLVLDPKGSPLMRVRVQNNGARTITIRTVRLEGSVIGLTFFAYDTSVRMRVPPGDEEDRAFEMDLVGLSGQAVGLIPSSVELLDEDRKVLAKQDLVVDVRGSLRSVYGIFGLAIIAFTLTALVSALVKLARHTLPPNRWKRGLRFGTPGLGAGLTAVFTLSALRIFAPQADKWVPLVAGAAVVGFVIGYLTPSPVVKEEEEEDEEEDEEDWEEEGEPPDAATRPTITETHRLSD